MIKCNVIADVENMRGKSVLVLLRPMRPTRNIRIHAWQELDLSAGAVESFEIDTTISAQISTRTAGTVTLSEEVPIPAGRLYQAIRPGGLSPKLVPASDGAANERVTCRQSGIYNQTIPAVPFDCHWLVGGSPVLTVPDVDWGMTCTFEYAPVLYFLVTAPQLQGDNFTVQTFSDATPYTLSPDTAELDVRVRWHRNRWLFDFIPDWA
jgi:hypothetical protein